MARKREYRYDILPPPITDSIDPSTPCAACGKQRPPISIENNDPYCCTECCRKDLGVTLPARI